MTVSHELPQNLQKYKQYVERYNFDYDRFTLLDVFPQCKRFAVMLFYETDGKTKQKTQNPDIA